VPPKESTNCALQYPGAVNRLQPSAPSLFTAAANVVTGLMVAIFGQQILLARSAPRVWPLGVTALLKRVSLAHSCPLLRRPGGPY